MEYSEYEEQASEYMRLAIPMMKKYKIAATPANYAVWYEYVSGKNAPLMDALDEHMIAHNNALSEQQSRELYQRFFDREKDRTVIFEMRQDLGRLLSEIVSSVSNGVDSSQQATEKLHATLEKLHPDMSSHQVHQVIEEILLETRVTIASHDMLSNRLNTALAEMHDLKQDLLDVKREARLDTLTQLANRRALDEYLTKVTQEADNSGNELCLIFCDIDFFKNINDQHGHLVGDQVLRMIADMLTDSVKGRDLVARYGGEEFAIVVMNTSLSNVKVLAENIRNEIESKRIQRKDTQQALAKITMSFGIASYCRSEGMDSFMQRADRALYMSKRQGRNTISEAPPAII